MTAVHLNRSRLRDLASLDGALRFPADQHNAAMIAVGTQKTAVDLVGDPPLLVVRAGDLVLAEVPLELVETTADDPDAWHVEVVTPEEHR